MNDLSSLTVKNLKEMSKSQNLCVNGLRKSEIVELLNKNYCLIIFTKQIKIF